MNVTNIPKALILTLGLAASAVSAMAQYTGTRAAVSIALVHNEEVGAYPATTAVANALTIKGGGYGGPQNPFGYVIPTSGTSTGLQYFSFKSTPTTNPNVFTVEEGYVIRSTAYNNRSFFSDLRKTGRASIAQTGPEARITAVRFNTYVYPDSKEVMARYDRNRIFLFLEGAAASPNPIFIGLLDTRDLYDITDGKYYQNIKTDNWIMMTGRYGVQRSGRATRYAEQYVFSPATSGVTTRQTVTFANAEDTEGARVTTAKGGTTLSGVSINFFPNNENLNMDFTVDGAHRKTEVWNTALKNTTNSVFSSTGLIGNGTFGGRNAMITGSVTFTAEALATPTAMQAYVLAMPVELLILGE